MSRAKLFTPVYMQFPLFLLWLFFYCHYSHNVTPLHSTNDGLRKSRCVTGRCFNLCLMQNTFVWLYTMLFWHHRNVMAVPLQLGLPALDEGKQQRLVAASCANRV